MGWVEALNEDESQGETLTMGWGMEVELPPVTTDRWRGVLKLGIGQALVAACLDAHTGMHVHKRFRGQLLLGARCAQTELPDSSLQTSSVATTPHPISRPL
jgi:hypothetical protein